MNVWQRYIILYAEDGRTTLGFVQLNFGEGGQAHVRARVVTPLAGRFELNLWNGNERHRLEMQAQRFVASFSGNVRLQPVRTVAAVANQNQRLIALGESEPPRANWQRVQQLLQQPPRPPQPPQPPRPPRPPQPPRPPRPQPRRADRDEGAALPDAHLQQAVEASTSVVQDIQSNLAVTDVPSQQSNALLAVQADIDFPKEQGVEAVERPTNGTALPLEARDGVQEDEPVARTADGDPQLGNATDDVNLPEDLSLQMTQKGTEGAWEPQERLEKDQKPIPSPRENERGSRRDGVGIEPQVQGQERQMDVQGACEEISLREQLMRRAIEEEDMQVPLQRLAEPQMDRDSVWPQNNRPEVQPQQDAPLQRMLNGQERQQSTDKLHVAVIDDADQTVQMPLNDERDMEKLPQLRGPYGPYWKWREVQTPGQGLSYLLGEAYMEGEIKAVAVAVPGTYAPAPPAHLQGFQLFTNGYWVLAQDAETGELISVED